MKKFSANWDRTAKRPPPVVEPQVRPKPKPKPSPKPKGGTVSPLQNDIVFVTPPMTPPLPPPEILAAPADVKKDDEFWKFFDQQVPK